MTDAALLASFVAHKMISTRSVAQLVFEVPIEQYDIAVAHLGGTPIPGESRFVAIARLDPGKIDKPAPEPKPSRRWEELSLAQQAGIRCNEPAFERFIEERYGWANTVEFVRSHCLVASRADLGHDDGAAERWRTLDDEFQAWLRVPV